MKKITLLSIALTLSFYSYGQKWSKEKANQWYATQKALIGANFLPSNAINQLEMWQKETFDPVRIDRELGWAAGIGMNTMRVYLHDLTYQNDKEGILNRMDQFLAIAEKHNIKILFVFFDSCWNDNPEWGKQPEPKPGIHNSGWVRSPGTKMLFDSRTWGKLEDYVKGTLNHFKNDKRVLAWDLFNEPSNSGYLDACLPLLKKSFEWALEVRPSQPVTAAIWNNHKLSNDVMLENSDIITFHNYSNPEKLEKQILELQKLGRPLICSEYMARRNNSLFQTCLPVFKKYGVGAINWGLVAGKSNTIYAWDEPVATGNAPKLWFHDIFRNDGSAYNNDEIEAIKAYSKR